MSELGIHGQKFYDSMTSCIVKHKEASTALILEAARAIDRLADLDDVISGTGVLSLLRFRLVDDEGRVAVVKFDAVLSEARQQQANFAGLMKTILPNLDPEAGAAKERDVLDEIAARRAARGASATSGSIRTGHSG